MVVRSRMSEGLSLSACACSIARRMPSRSVLPSSMSITCRHPATLKQDTIECSADVCC